MEKLVTGCHECPALRWSHASYVTCAFRYRPFMAETSHFTERERDYIRTAREVRGTPYRPSWCPLPITLLREAPKAPPVLRPLVYIAAPFAACEGRTERANVCRAVTLSRHAQWCGHAPICVHPSILAGAYGDDTDATDREAGLRTCLSILDGLKAAGGVVWVLLRDDGFMSEGTSREVSHAEAIGLPCSRATWAGWVRAMTESGFPPEVSRAPRS